MPQHRWIARAAGLALGVLADRVFADPRRGHPVAWFGRASGKLEKRTYADSTSRGALHVAACLVPLAAAGVAIERTTRSRPVLHALTTAVTTWAVLGAASLEREGNVMADLLEAEDVPGARERITHLCGRDPDALDQAELARAAIESMAENTSDAAVASLWWGAVAGVPGLLVHRGANTLDAMIGHRNARYRRFGTAAARFDDAVNLLPARLTGALACALAPAVGGSARRAWRVMWRDHADHPSPNGGWCEAAWAGALGVQLGGRNVYYGSRVEDRGLLGDGPRPGTATVRPAARLVGRVTAAATVLAAGYCLTRR